MTLANIIKRELAETKHYELNGDAIFCRCGYYLVSVAYDKVEYWNRRGRATLYAADPHFFDKLKKLLVEIHRRTKTHYSAFEEDSR